MKPGCCSAISPCSHQQRDPTTICDICQRSADSYAASESAKRLTPGLQEAIRVIEGMDNSWPNALPPSVRDDYGRQFAMRIRERIAALSAGQRQNEG